MAGGKLSLRDSTTQLLAALRAGDSQALGRLFTRHVTWLRRWASGRLPSSVRDGVDTSDIVQDTLVATFARMARFETRHSGSLRAYLRTALTNRVRDEVRRARRRPTEARSDLDEIVSPAKSPLEGLLDQETANRFSTALGRLGERDQLAVVARYEMNLSYQQVAIMLGNPSAEAARKAVTRAIARLAEEMANVDEHA